MASLNPSEHPDNTQIFQLKCSLDIFFKNLKKFLFFSVPTNPRKTGKNGQTFTEGRYAEDRNNLIKS